MINLLKKYADNYSKNSIAHTLRVKRFKLFLSLVKNKKNISILDVGGTYDFWMKMNPAEVNANITILNLSKEAAGSKPENFPFEVKQVIGDARKMHNFIDDEFDIVFSNSVIEHVGSFNDQMSMAEEIQRVGKGYFVQTPNFYFPIEPHFLLPYFQILPLFLKVRIVLFFNINFWWDNEKIRDYDHAYEVASEVRLMTIRELKNMFLNCLVYKEKFMLLNKSFIVYKKF